MRKHFPIPFVLLILTIIVMSFSQSQNSNFYYAYDEKIYLNEVENKIIIRYNQKKKTIAKNNILRRNHFNKTLSYI